MLCYIYTKARRATSHQRTADTPAGSGRADTPAGGGQAGATLRTGMELYIHACAMGEGGDAKGAPTWRGKIPAQPRPLRAISARALVLFPNPHLAVRNCPFWLLLNFAVNLTAI